MSGNRRFLAVLAILMGGYFYMDRQDQIDTLARTMWGEARGEGAEGMTGVAFAVLNRVAYAQARDGYWWGSDIVSVCRQPWQFSCWNENDPNFPKLQAVTTADPTFALAVRIATAAINGELADPTNGATHYHTLSVAPNWADPSKVVASLGSHTYYGGIS